MHEYCTYVITVGVGTMFESVCLFVCLFVPGINHKRMIPKCSNTKSSKSKSKVIFNGLPVTNVETYMQQ